MAEALRHFVPKPRLQRSAGAGKNAVYANWCFICRFDWQPGQALDMWSNAGDCGMCRRCHYPIGYLIRFPFQWIVTRADGEFGQQAIRPALCTFAACIRPPTAMGLALET
ncbi:MAG: hypothetical protein NT154_21895, partial [Verrucomicrobia bacterium]|nr:hypothetical protein [Verrucomicrobiota bacterium]